MPQTRFDIRTDGPGLYEITAPVLHWVESLSMREGVLTLFIRHTSASLLIQENADPDVQGDLRAFFDRLVPPATHPDMTYLRHRGEGPDDMPAHIRAAMMPVSLNIPVEGGVPLLGRWQGIYVFEHRSAVHVRQVAAHLSKG